MTKQYIYFKYENNFYKIAKIENRLDGSTYLFFPGNTKEKTGKVHLRKISMHTTGQINYQTNPPITIFEEPITQFDGLQFIVSIYIPKLELLEINETLPNDSICININTDSNVIVQVIKYSNKKQLDELPLLNGFIYIISSLIKFAFFISQGKIDERCKDKIRWYYPGKGKYDSIASNMDKFEAKKELYNVLYNKEGLKLCGPYQDGRFELVLEAVMNQMPLLKIEFENPNYYVKPIEASKVHMLFEVRDKKHGHKKITDISKLKIKSLMISCEPGIENTEEGRSMTKFPKEWK